MYRLVGPNEIYEYMPRTEGNGVCSIDSADWRCIRGRTAQPWSAEVHIG